MNDYQREQLAALETVRSEGCASPLMYLHNSPGLLRVKRRAGLMRP
jgi:hypothetical protein